MTHLPRKGKRSKEAADVPCCFETARQSSSCSCATAVEPRKTASGSTEQRRAHLLGRLPLQARHDMRIEIQGHGDRGMPERLLNHLRVDAKSQRDRCGQFPRAAESGDSLTNRVFDANLDANTDAGWCRSAHRGARFARMNATPCIPLQGRTMIRKPQVKGSSPFVGSVVSKRIWLSASRRCRAPTI